MIDKLFELMRIILGITAQGVGEQLPANMPATMGVINQQVAQTTYDAVIEEQHLFQKELFNDFMLPAIFKRFTSRKIVEIEADPTELEELDEILVTNELNREIADFKDKWGYYGVEMNGQHFFFDRAQYQSQYDQIKQERLAELRKDKTRFADLPKELTNILEFGIEFYVNAESFDANKQNQELLQVMQIPDNGLSNKKLAAQIVENNDLDSRQFQMTPEEEAQKAQEMMMQNQMPVPVSQNTPGEMVGKNIPSP